MHNVKHFMFLRSSSCRAYYNIDNLAHVLSMLFSEFKATQHPIHPIFTMFLVKFLLILMNIIVKSFDNIACSVMCIDMFVF